MAENNYWTTEGDQGTIKISEDVVASIAAIAAGETDGVSSLCTSLTTDIAVFLGKKSLSKGVKIVFQGELVAVDVSFLANYGCSVLDVAKKVQTQVKSSVESMTGLRTSMVNVHICGVSLDAPMQMNSEPVAE